MIEFKKNERGNIAAAGWEIIPLYRANGRAYRWVIGREADPTEGDAWITHSVDTLREAKYWVLDQCTPCPGDIPLQLYGHPVNVPYDRLVSLHEVSICSTANGLRKLAQHLLQAADDMDNMGETFDHVHFQPHSRPEIVVCRFSEDHDHPIVWDDALDGYKQDG
jgi:hypothetical protein